MAVALGAVAVTVAEGTADATASGALTPASGETTGLSPHLSHAAVNATINTHGAHLEGTRFAPALTSTTKGHFEPKGKPPPIEGIAETRRRDTSGSVGGELAKALMGGGLIGLGASILLFGTGRVAGISGIFFTSMVPKTSDRGWRLAFVAGMIATGAILAIAFPGSVQEAPANLAIVGVSGLAVGFGTRLGSGCTSGHGVCGNARLSIRSIVATCLFMAGGGIALIAAWAIGGPLR